MPGGPAKHETLRRKNEFEELRIRKNVRLCKLLALVLLAINAILLAVDLTIFLPFRTDNVSYFYLYLLHIISSVFAVLWLVVQGRLSHAEKAERSRLLYRIFANAILIWGVLIALNDLPMNGQISVYFITIFGIAALLYIPPHEALLSFSLTMAVFVAGMIFLVPEPRLLYVNILNAVIAAFLSFMVSRLKFVAFLE